MTEVAASTGHLGRLIALLRTHVDEPAPPPRAEDRLDRVLYGLAQPLWGLRQVAGNRELLGLALAPVVLVAAVCAVVAWGEAKGEAWWRIAAAFFVTFAALAPVPPVLFQRTYARIAARVRNEMGLGPREPYLRGLFEALWESLTLVLVIGIGVAPVIAVLGWIPAVGALWAGIVHAVWSLHWIVVEAFDTARTLEPGQKVRDVEKAGAARPGRPWFSRPYHRPMPFPLRLVLLVFRLFADVAAWLAARWRPEVDRVEAQPWIALGFGLGTVLLLAIPGVNLLFRPAIVIGAAHLSGRFDIAERRAHPGPHPQVGPTGTQPYPSVDAGA